MVRWILGGLLAAWLVWSLTFDGGLHELKSINPNFVHPNKSVAFLLENLHSSEPSNGYLYRSMRVDDCALYMPNWEAAEICVNAKDYCERRMPKGGDIIDYIYKAEYRTCYKERKPTDGVIEMLRAIKPLVRLVAAYPIILVCESCSGGLERWINKAK